MRTIKISAIGSTNDYLKELIKNTEVEDGTIVHTKHQTHGKGQRGAHWFFEIGKSLAFSVFMKFSSWPVQDQFYINFAVSMGVKIGLESMGIPKVAIKWPNDILSDGKKVCGILVENQFQSMHISSSVIGIGVNVNNTSFTRFPHASSLLLNTGIRYNPEEVMHAISQSVVKQLKKLDTSTKEALKQEYESYLFRKDEVVVFEDTLDRKFQGIIEGVTEQGLLCVRKKDRSLQHFQLKEIKLLY